MYYSNDIYHVQQATQLQCVSRESRAGTQCALCIWVQNVSSYIPYLLLYVWHKNNMLIMRCAWVQTNYTLIHNVPTELYILDADEKDCSSL